MLETLMMGLLAGQVVNNTKSDEERFKEICAGSQLTPIEELALLGLVSQLGANPEEVSGILKTFGITR